jgi:SAM-dependent methyltransferase
MKRAIGIALARWPKKLSRRRPYPFLEKHLQMVPAGATVLNIGSGGGYDDLVRRIAEERKFTVKSTDIDPAREPDIVDDICNSGLESGSVEWLVMADVLEHVQNPFDAAREIGRILKPGGTALLVVPFFYPIHARPHDYFRFTEYGLRLLFADLEVADFEYRSNWLEALLLGAARIVYEPGKTARLAILVIPICALLLPLASLIGRGPGYITAGYMMKLVRRADLAQRLAGD